jgi:hypothetical protein
VVPHLPLVAVVVVAVEAAISKRFFPRSDRTFRLFSPQDPPVDLTPPAGFLLFDRVSAGPVNRTHSRAIWLDRAGSREEVARTESIVPRDFQSVGCLRHRGRRDRAGYRWVLSTGRTPVQSGWTVPVTGKRWRGRKQLSQGISSPLGVCVTEVEEIGPGIVGSCQPDALPCNLAGPRRSPGKGGVEMENIARGSPIREASTSQESKTKAGYRQALSTGCTPVQSG